MGTASFSCQCGTVNGAVSNATPAQGNHVCCFCASCRAAALYCGADIAPTDGVALFQVMPEQITLTAGQDQISPFAFGPRNLLRWRAECCGVQLFSSPRNPKMPLVGVIAERLDDPGLIGPVKSRAFVPKKDGKTGHENTPALLRVIGRMLLTRLSGRWRQTPLFDVDSLTPVKPVILISKTEKATLLGR